MKKSILFSVILFFLSVSLVFNLYSCGKNKTDEDETESLILTGVYRGDEIEFPDGYSFNSSVAPIIDGDTITAITECYRVTENTDGSFNYDYGPEAIVYNLTSGEYTSQKIHFTDGEYLSYGVFDGDSLVFVSCSYDMDTEKSSCYVNTLDIVNGKSTRSDEISGFFNNSEKNGYFYINGLAVDGDGYIYISSESEIAVLDKSYVFQFSVNVPYLVNTMATDGEGKVRISTFGNSGQVLKTIDRENEDISENYDVIENNANEVFFGKGYDVYYSNDIGVYGMNYGDEPELKMNYINSDVGTLQIVAIPDSETLIAVEYDLSDYKTHAYIYRHIHDIDLSDSEMKVIKVAYDESSINSLTESISAFNRTHDTVRIVALDYSVYSTADNYFGGTEKLIDDMIAGRCKPDVVISDIDGRVTKTVYAQRLYTDILPLMGDDYEDIFGCVKKTFETDEGGLWALCDRITVSSLAGRSDVLGKRISWTMSEMLDFAKSLDEDTMLIAGLTQNNAFYNLLGDKGYGAFVDTANKTCSFDSEDFISYLEYLKMLSEQDDSGIPDDYYSDKTKYFIDKKVVLEQITLCNITDYFSLPAVYGTNDITFIGYPTETVGNGTSISSSYAYIITSYCKNTAEAYDFISAAIHNIGDSEENIIPIFKSDYLEIAEKYKSYDSENHINIKEIDSSDIIGYISDDDIEEFSDFLDGIGCPLGSYVSEDITSIVSEEISAYLADQKSSSDCANVIQSRVLIWLEEHAD